MTVSNADGYLSLACILKHRLINIKSGQGVKPHITANHQKKAVSSNHSLDWHGRMVNLNSIQACLVNATRSLGVLACMASLTCSSNDIELLNSCVLFLARELLIMNGVLDCKRLYTTSNLIAIVIISVNRIDSLTLLLLSILLLTSLCLFPIPGGLQVLNLIED